MTVVEVLAVIAGLLCVWLTVRRNIWCWPIGLIQVVLYIVVFARVRLYSDVMLQVIYIPMQIYGWHHWLRGDERRSTLPVTTLSSRDRLLWGAVAVIGSALWGFAMATWTNAAAPYGDAFIVVSSLAAHWLLARKKVESWVLWIAVDLVAVGVYGSRGLALTTGLYIVYLGLAAAGLSAWHRAAVRTP